MKLKIISYLYSDQTATYFIEEWIMLHGTEKTEIENEEDLAEDFFYNHIQGSWCDRCTSFDEVKDRFEIEEITI